MAARRHQPLGGGASRSDSDSDQVEITLVPDMPRSSGVQRDDMDMNQVAPPSGAFAGRSWLCVCVTLFGVAIVAVFLFLLVSAVEKSARTSVQLGSEADADAASAMFRAGTSSEGARQSLKYYTDESHLAGSDRDKATAEYTRDKFLEFGLPQADIEEFQVLLNEPEADGAVVDILSPASAAFTAGLKEAVIDSDPMTKKPHPGPFNGYAPSADVNGSYVYANYGRVEDFEALATAGVDVRGRVVLCRYGRIFRGNKVENSESRGAIAVIIYSDPQDDGFVRGPEYPQGPWRPPTGVQRGSVFTGEGDPLTPSYPATTESLRLTLREGRNFDDVGAGWALPTIPSIPISWQDAKPLMEALTGQLASAMAPNGAWVGGMPDVTYRVGPSTAVVRVKTRNKFAVKPIWNVIGTIPGAIEPDRWVLIGNHRDAWVAGGSDPSSGSAALLEVARGLGKLLETGWRPDRTIMLCSWDAEEYGLLGSTEWVEAHFRSVQNKAVTYINVDEAIDSQGPAQMYSTPSLTKVIYRAAKAVPQPACSGPGAKDVEETMAQLCSDAKIEEGDSVYDFWLRKKPLADSSPAVPYLGLLGSGSDHTAFIAHAGVSAMAMSFSGDQYGVYHSVYDSYEWMANFGDPSFKYHEAAARFAGTLAIMLANDAVLPFDFTDYADAMVRYEASLVEHLVTLGGSDAAPPGGLEAGTSEEWGVPTSGPAPATPHTLDTARLTTATNKFKEAAEAAKAEAQALAEAASGGGETDPNFLFKVRAMNDRLMYTERCFIAPEGLPGRNWYKHVVFTPSLHNSYGSTAFPAVNDALAVGDWRQAQRQLDIVIHLLNRATEALTGDLLPAAGAL